MPPEYIILANEGVLLDNYGEVRLDDGSVYIANTPYNAGKLGRKLGEDLRFRYEKYAKYLQQKKFDDKAAEDYLSLDPNLYADPDTALQRLNSDAFIADCAIFLSIPANEAKEFQSMLAAEPGGAGAVVFGEIMGIVRDYAAAYQRGKTLGMEKAEASAKRNLAASELANMMGCGDLFPKVTETIAFRGDMAVSNGVKLEKAPGTALTDANFRLPETGSAALKSLADLNVMFFLMGRPFNTIEDLNFTVDPQNPNKVTGFCFRSLGQFSGFACGPDDKAPVIPNDIKFMNKATAQTLEALDPEVYKKSLMDSGLSKAAADQALHRLNNLKESIKKGSIVQVEDWSPFNLEGLAAGEKTGLFKAVANPEAAQKATGVAPRHAVVTGTIEYDKDDFTEPRFNYYTPDRYYRTIDGMGFVPAGEVASAAYADENGNLIRGKNAQARALAMLREGRDIYAYSSGSEYPKRLQSSPEGDIMISDRLITEEKFKRKVPEAETLQAAKKWYGSFKKEMAELGIDLSDPAQCSRIYTYRKLRAFDDIGEYVEFDEYMSVNVPMGKNGYKNPVPRDHRDYCKWLLDNMKPMDNLNDKEILRLFDLSRSGCLNVMDEYTNMENSEQIYVKDDFTSGVSVGAKNIILYPILLDDAIKKESINKKFPGMHIEKGPENAVFDPKVHQTVIDGYYSQVDPYFRPLVKNYQEAEVPIYQGVSDPLSYAREFSSFYGNDSATLLALPEFLYSAKERNYMLDYMQQSSMIRKELITFPEYYATKELAKARAECYSRLKTANFAERSQFSRSRTISNSIRKTGLTLNEAAKAGYIIDPEGKPYSPQEPPWALADKLAEDFGANRIPRLHLPQKDGTYQIFVMNTSEVKFSGISEFKAEDLKRWDTEIKTGELIGNEVDEALKALNTYCNTENKKNYYMAKPEEVRERILAVTFAAYTLKDAYDHSNDPEKASVYKKIVKNGMGDVIGDMLRSKVFKSYAAKLNDDDLAAIAAGGREKAAAHYAALKQAFARSADPAAKAAAHPDAKKQLEVKAAENNQPEVVPIA